MTTDSSPAGSCVETEDAGTESDDLKAAQEGEGQTGLSLDDYLELLEETTGGWEVRMLCRQSEITGEPAVRTIWTVGLSVEQAINEYMHARSVNEWWTTQLSFNGWLQSLCRCGQALFASIACMDAGQKVDGMLQLVSKSADIVAIVREATFIIAQPRFAAAEFVAAAVLHGDAKAQYTGSSAVLIGRWLGCWERMNLSHLHGFPTWDSELFHSLQPHFANLCRLFAAYSAPLPRTEAELSPPPLESWSAALELLPDQWTQLLFDMGITLSGKALNVFDIPFEQRRAERCGRPGVDLSAFVSALIGAAFYHSNPQHEAASTMGDIDLERLVPVPVAIQDLLEQRVPLALMRKCLGRLQADVDLARAIQNDKVARLQQARTRERNHAIEAAGALKRQTNGQEPAEGDQPRRKLRHQRSGDDGSAKRKIVDPAELHADVERKQQVGIISSALRLCSYPVHHPAHHVSSSTTSLAL